MGHDLILKGVFTAESAESPLRLERRKTSILAEGEQLSGSEEELLRHIALAGARFAALAADEDTVSVAILDGTDGVWLLSGQTMPFHFRECLERISDEAGGLPPEWGVVFLLGISSTLSPDQASDLETQMVRAACQASAGRCFLNFLVATLDGDQVIYHILGEDEITAILTGQPAPPDPKGEA